MQGITDFNLDYYIGPCPPAGTHRYFFKVYVLDAMLQLPVNTRKDGLEKAMSEHIFEFGRLVELCKKVK